MLEENSWGGLGEGYFCGFLGHLLVEIDEVLLILCLGDLEERDAGDLAGHGECWCGGELVEWRGKYGYRDSEVFLEVWRFI